MPEPVSDPDRCDLPPFAPAMSPWLPPAPTPRWKRVVHWIGALALCAAVAVAVFALFTAVNHAGRVVQHDVHVAVDRALDHIADRMAAAHCGPPPGR